MAIVSHARTDGAANNTLTAAPPTASSPARSEIQKHHGEESFAPPTRRGLDSLFQGNDAVGLAGLCTTTTCAAASAAVLIIIADLMRNPAVSGGHCFTCQNVWRCEYHADGGTTHGVISGLIGDPEAARQSVYRTPDAARLDSLLQGNEAGK